MSSNGHPNPCSVFPCSVCAENVIWRGRSVQCYTCYKWVHLKSSLLFFSRFRTLSSFDSWSCPYFYVPASSEDPTLTSTVTSSSDSSSLYTSSVQSGPSAHPLLMQHSHPTLAINLVFFFRSFRIFSLCTITIASCFWMFIFTSCFLFSSLNSSGFFNGMLAFSKSEALLLPFISSHPVDLICIQEFNLNLSSFFQIPGFSALRPNCIHSQHGIFLPMSHTLAAALSFSSGRAYPSLNFLLGLFLRLTPTLIM